MVNQTKVYEEAKLSLGHILSSGNPEFGCAITVNNIVKRALGLPVGGGYSTRSMYECLRDGVGTRFNFIELEDAQAGDIIISPTGQGNGDLPNGHVGIVANDTSVDGTRGIISNDSASGQVHEYWTVGKWKKFYGEVGGYPIYIFRFI